jgi:ornithine carbamoyltransferase
VSTSSDNDFLTLRSLSDDELEEILERTDQLKDREMDLCESRTLILLFEKRSTRTRVSFSTGFQQLGGRVVFLGSDDVQLARGETIADTARTLSRYADAVACRTFGQDRVQELGVHFNGPVINALTDRSHPCQALSDVYTMFKHSGANNLSLAYVGDGNNVCRSLMEAARAFDLEIRVASPPGYEPEGEVVNELTQRGTNLTVHQDPVEAVTDVDFVYTDVWVSMGDKNAEQRRRDLQDYQINMELLSHAAKEVKVMHCLPAHRGEEITANVMDGPRSIVFDQVENRLHVQKALMAYLMVGSDRLRQIDFP